MNVVLLNIEWPMELALQVSLLLLLLISFEMWAALWQCRDEELVGVLACLFVACHDKRARGLDGKSRLNKIWSLA